MLRACLALTVFSAAVVCTPAAADEKGQLYDRPPIPSFPLIAAEKGLSGKCNVLFDVSAKGRPINVRAACTSQYFCRSSIRAVEKTQMRPKVVDGIEVPRMGVVYPMEYSTNSEEISKDMPLVPCE